jgi:asparagine synthetase B (glutamine-hydrolysing)
MCGIFGIITKSNHITNDHLDKITSKLFILSETRGKEASGIAFIEPDKVNIYKEPISASKFIKTDKYSELFSSFKKSQGAKALIGHSRMVTNGTEEDQRNNQPVYKNRIVCIQNGIIVNEDEIWKSLEGKKKREYIVDTECINAIVSNSFDNDGTMHTALTAVFDTIKGATSTAIFHKDYNQLGLGTNNGSLYISENEDFIIFASEIFILNEIQQFINKKFTNLLKINSQHIGPHKHYIITINNVKGYKEDLNNIPSELKQERTINIFDRKGQHDVNINTLNADADEKLLQTIEWDKINALKRCSKCLLPETFPFITYNEKGVCIYCQNHKPLEYKGEEALEKLVSKYRSNSNQLDCIVPFSGGRDSSYAIHYIKNELNMNPVAYTYDWGMVTDLARRNISRICGELGIEHILISADIRKKRENIGKNVSAWLKRPHLGTIPLFMAGDKQFFYYANQLQKQFNIDLLIFGMNRLERTDFKVAFTGINELKDKNSTKHYNMSLAKKLKMIGFYGKEYLLNPAYINSSLIDTMFGFFSYYMIRQDYYTFFDYIKWEEGLVNNTIIDKYDWEVDPTTKTTWRIGDGTATFYNYIYLKMAGFTENDTFRSNQIREGLITREQALKEVEYENQPRYETIKWYCNAIGIDFNKAITAINNAKTLY